MKLKEKMYQLYFTTDRKFKEQFGFRMKDTTFLNIVEYLHAPKDASSLAVTRILFGLAMLFDIPDERGGATMDRRWGTPVCHFPLLPFIQAVPMPYMALVYAYLWMGAVGIMLGYNYRVCSAMFTACYWYLFLIEKSFWNNHSYLFGLVGFLLTFTNANCYWSLDAFLNPQKLKTTVPYWNYFVLKYQFFILYFMAGMKKGTAEWLTGYSVQKLAEHWVFDPFKLILTVSQIDYLIVHWFIFLFDLTVAIWMMWARTRNIAMIFCALFHLMNSRLFRIGMFPWICLATMPLFYPFDWPKTLYCNLKKQHETIRGIISNCHTAFRKSKTCDCEANREVNDEEDNVNGKEVLLDDNKAGSSDQAQANNGTTSETAVNQETNSQSDSAEDTISCETVSEQIESTVSKSFHSEFEDSTSEEDRVLDKPKDIGLKKRITTCLIMMFVLTQAFLPYSHFITKGYNNWTNGLYGYSWDMMVHTWDTQSVVVKIVDNENKQEYFIDPSHYALNDRWTRHGDMVYQYANCLKDKIIKENEKSEHPKPFINISIYVDVWCSMNGRFTQRLFDPKKDLLQETWSAFAKVPYLMPVIDEAVHWRSKLQEITENVHAWNKNNEVVFFAEFPNYEQEKYIPLQLTNVTLTVLEGTVAYQPEASNRRIGQSYRLDTGDRIHVESGLFHKVINIGHGPAYYMYIYKNATVTNAEKELKPKLPVLHELAMRFKGMLMFTTLLTKNIFQLVFGCNGDC